MNKIKRLGAVLAIPVVLLLASCSDKSTEPFRDAPRAGESNDSPAQVINMPDGFSNLASKCDGPNRVYTSYKGDENRTAIAVVKDDPRCTDGE